MLLYFKKKSYENFSLQTIQDACVAVYCKKLFLLSKLDSPISRFSIESAGYTHNNPCLF